jgi:hypothetical protein
MQLGKKVSVSVLAASYLFLLSGCGEGTDVKLAPVPQLRPADSTPLPKDAKKGGGPSSSGNSGKNPGANT